MDFIYNHEGNGELVDYYREIFKPHEEPLDRRRSCVDSELPYLVLPPGSLRIKGRLSSSSVAIRVVEDGASPEYPGDREERYEKFRMSNINQLLSYGQQSCNKSPPVYLDGKHVSYDFVEEEFIFLNGARSKEFEIHVELNPFFAYEAAEIVFNSLTQASPFFNLSQQQVRTLQPYMKAAIFFDTCAHILRVSHPTNIEHQLDKYHPLRPFNSGLACDQIIEQLESLQSFRLISEGPIHIVNCMVIFHRFLFYGLCADINTPMSGMIDIKKSNGPNGKPLVFAGEYSSYLAVRKMIVKKFKSLQEIQACLFERMEKTGDNVKDESKIPLVAPTDFKVQDFNPRSPFSILNNVPTNSPYYRHMELLCFGYDINLINSQRLFPNDWTAALMHFHPKFNLKRFTHLLGVEVVHPKINGNFMLQQFLNFKSRFDDLDDLFNVFRNKSIVPDDVGLNPFISDKKFIMRSQSTIQNIFTEPLSQTTLVAGSSSTMNSIPTTLVGSVEKRSNERKETDHLYQDQIEPPKQDNQIPTNSVNYENSCVTF